MKVTSRPREIRPLRAVALRASAGKAFSEMTRGDAHKGLSSSTALVVQFAKPLHRHGRSNLLANFLPLSRRGELKTRFLTRRCVRYGSVETGAHCAPLQVGANIAHRGILLIRQPTSGCHLPRWGRQTGRCAFHHREPVRCESVETADRRLRPSPLPVVRGVQNFLEFSLHKNHVHHTPRVILSVVSAIAGGAFCFLRRGDPRRIC